MDRKMFSSTSHTDIRSVASSIPNLKPSLKVSTGRSAMRSSHSCTFVPALRKNVRFAADLTRVKSFHENDKPISISSETSPELLPHDPVLNSGCDWFNNDAALAMLLPGSGMKMTRMMKSFSLDSANGASASRYSSGSQFRRYSDIALGSYDYDCDLDDFDSCSGSEDEDDYFYGDDSSANPGKIASEGDGIADFEVKHWKLTYTSIPQQQADDLLCGQEVKLGSIVQEGEQLVGLIYVANLCYEKFVEVKYTFTNWSDIHYVTATYTRSVNDGIDEFRFTINLSSLDYFLKYKKILYCNPALDITVCPLSVDLCCRYYVNGQTYYDNNHSQNYQLSILTTTRNLLKKSSTRGRTLKGRSSSKGSGSGRVPKKNSPSTSFYADFLVSTTLSHKIHLLSDNKRDPYARKFSEDTDYFNTSPYKHLYHNDTTLIRPTRLNKVLNSCAEDDIGISNNNNNNSPGGAEGNVSPLTDGNKISQSSLMSRNSSMDSMNSDMLAGISSSSSVTSSPVGGSGIPLDDFTDLAFDDFNSSFGETHDPYKLLANPLKASLGSERLRGYKKSYSPDPLDRTDPLPKLGSAGNNGPCTNLGIESDTDDDSSSINPLSFVADYYNDATVAPFLGGFGESDTGYFNDNQSVVTDTPVLGSRRAFYNEDGNCACQGNNSTDTLVFSDKVTSTRDESRREGTVGCDGRSNSPVSSTCSSASDSSTSSFYSANMTPSETGLSQNQHPGTICTSMSGTTMDSVRSRAEPNCPVRTDFKHRLHTLMDTDYQTLLESYCFYTSERGATGGMRTGVRGGGISITDEDLVRSTWKCSSPPMSLDYLRTESPPPVPIR